MYARPHRHAPDAAEVLAFVADKDPQKRDKLVDRLLETPEYAYFFANKWADILRVKRRNQPDRAVRHVRVPHLDPRGDRRATSRTTSSSATSSCAIGDETKSPPTVWYKEVRTPENFVDDVSQVFLGQRLACANCHHHPYEKWSQDDYWGLAAFFGRVGTKAVPMPGAVEPEPAEPEAGAVRHADRQRAEQADRPDRRR